MEQKADGAASKTVVCDLGTASIKCGWAGADLPIRIPSIIGRPLSSEEGLLKDIYVGDEVVAASSSSTLGRKNLLETKPIDSGVIRSFEDMMHLWNHMFDDKLQRRMDDIDKILLVERPLIPREVREKTTQIMFESFGFRGVYLGIQQVTALCAQGLLNGIVVDLGESGGIIVPVYEVHTLLLPD